MADTMKLSLGLEDKSFKQGMKDANKELKTLQQTAKELGKDNSIEGMSKQAQNAKKQFENLTKQLKDQRDELDRLEKKTEEYRQELNKVEQGSSAYEALEKAIQNTEKRMRELKNEIELTEARANNAESTFKNLENAIENTGEEAEDTADTLEEVADGVEDIRDGVERLNKVEFGKALTEGGKTLLEVVGKICEGYKELINAGSEYSSANAQTEMVFSNLGKEAQNAVNSITELASTFGQTERATKSGATELASYMKAMGLTDETIANMLPSMVQLVADMSAFANVPFDDALGDFKSALMGNHEAVDKYNINIAESTMNMSAYAEETGKTVSKMTEEEKLLARVSTALGQSADYYGLAQQEASEFTAQQQLMNSQLDELKGTIGEKLLPIFEPFVQKINEVIGKVSEWVEENPKLVETLGEIGVAVTAFIAVLGGLSIIAGIITAISAFSGVLALLCNPITLVITAISALVGALVYLWLNWDDVTKWISEAWGNMTTWVCDKATQLKEWVVTKFSELVTKATEFFSNLPYNIGKFMGETYTKAKTWAEDMKSKATEMAQTFLNNVVNFFKNLPNNVKTWLDNTIEKVKTWKTNMVNKGKEVGKEVTDNVINGLKQLPSKVFDIGKKVVESLWNGIKSVGSWFSNQVSSFVNGVMDGILGRSMSMEVDVNGDVNIPQTEVINAPIRGLGNAINAISSFDGSFATADIGSGYVDAESPVSRAFTSGSNPLYGGANGSSYNSRDGFKGMFEDLAKTLMMNSQQPITIEVNNPVVREEQDIYTLTEEIMKQMDFIMNVKNRRF